MNQRGSETTAGLGLWNSFHFHGISFFLLFLFLVNQRKLIINDYQLIFLLSSESYVAIGEACNLLDEAIYRVNNLKNLISSCKNNIFVHY